jgi:hypothetical protein
MPSVTHPHRKLTVEQNERARIEADRKWRELSISSVTVSGSHKPYFELATDRQDSGVSVG